MELKITNKDHFDDIGEPHWDPVESMDKQFILNIYQKTQY